jgi:phage terminase small subunit
MEMMESLTHRMQTFAVEYCLDHDGKKAAIRAGYSEHTAAVRACKLLKHPGVKLLIDRLDKKSRDDFEIQRYEILYHLWACATRDGRNLVNDRGELLSPQEIKNLPDSVGLAIDSIKQKVIRRWTEDDGTEVDILETEIKLVSKAAAIEMAMKHKGLFELDNAQQKHVTIDFDQLFKDQRHTIDVDSIEERLRIEEQG